MTRTLLTTVRSSQGLPHGYGASPSQEGVVVGAVSGDGGRVAVFVFCSSLSLARCVSLTAHPARTADTYM